jgi:hypothetical protein
MTTDWRTDFMSRYPTLFPNVAYRDFSVDQGWEPLLDNLCKQLVPIVEDAKLEDFSVDQVKEKFGGLRFYVSSMTKEGWELISKAENDSYNICEDCGQPGQARQGSWIRTQCDEHAKGKKVLEW